MSIYVIALFLHVSGTLGYFISAGARLMNVAALRRAQRVEQVRLITTLGGWLGPVFGISLLVLLVAGFNMAAKAWSFRAGWIAVALVNLVPIAVSGALLMEPRRRAIASMAHAMPDGPISETLAARIHDPLLQAATRTLPVLLLGIVFLMTTKPTLGGSVIAMAVALLLALVFAAFGSRRRGTPVRLPRWLPRWRRSARNSQQSARIACCFSPKGSRNTAAVFREHANPDNYLARWYGRFATATPRWV
jgi:hypothetical protein